MKILILEDEYHAAQLLKRLILQIEPQTQILAVLDSLEETTKWFAIHPMPDLIFMDIQLADGLSLEIFQQVNISCPVIFTTAYDQYSLQAFKVNSVDYLLKPVDKEELGAALKKYHQYHQSQRIDPLQLQLLLQNIRQEQNYKSRFLIKQGQTWHYLTAEEVAYIYAEDGLVFLMDKKGKRHLLETTLEELALELNPDHFFRINRKQIVHFQAISEIHPFFNHRLKLSLRPESKLENIVVRDKVKTFKAWLDR